MAAANNVVLFLSFIVNISKLKVYQFIRSFIFLQLNYSCNFFIIFTIYLMVILFQD